MLQRLLLLTTFAASTLAGIAGAQNEECSGAVPLALGATPYDTSGATTSAPAWPCAIGGADLWFVFNPPSMGSYTVTTCTGTGYDSALEAFTGPCNNLVSLTCNDDSCGLQSTLGFLATVGTPIYLRVGGYNGLSGAGTLTVTRDVPVLNPANGHYYQVVSTTVDWNTADQMARSMTHLGLPGHLATLANAAEDQFVYFTLAGGPLGNAWLGGYQDLNAPSYSEPLGGWTWVTGEAFIYTNWTTGEPNDNGGQEHYLGYWPAEQWNDYTLVSTPTNVGRFVVEFESTGIGANYCTPGVANSTGAPAHTTAEGSASAAANDVTLITTSLPQSSFGYYLNSRNQGLVVGPGGSQGILCLGGAIGRFTGPGQIQNSGALGRVSLQVNLMSQPTPIGPVSVQPGETWRFQLWYRDANPTVTSNFSDGLAITFL